MKHIAVKSLALIALACSLATTARAESFAKRVDIGGGRMMYIECQGSGSPTVVLMSGARAASDSWPRSGSDALTDILVPRRLCMIRSAPVMFRRSAPLRDQPGADHASQPPWKEGA
jgi:hypothetical protein